MAVALTAPDTLQADLSAYPLVIIRFPKVIDHTALAALREAQERVYAFQRQYISFVDMRGTQVMPRPTVRKDASEWTKAQEPLLKRWQVANVLVVDSALTRAGIQAVHWFAPPPVPTIVTGSFVEGARYLREQAVGAGLPLSLLANNRLDTLEHT